MSKNAIAGFNPLLSQLPTDSFDGLPEGIFTDAIKGTVQTILSSYTGFFDLFSETIQNALDATEKKYRAKGAVYSPKVWITINMQDSVLRVIDNGCGMNLNEFLLCFRPNMTFKKGQNLRGNKGVGATFLAYGYNYVNLQTKINEDKYGAILRQGRLWIEDEKNTMPYPTYEEVKFSVPELSNEESGTCIEIRLQNSQFEKPKDFGWYGATKANQWLDMLRITTPLGGIYLDTPIYLPTIELTVIDKSGTETFIPPTKGVEYYYPHDIPNQKVNSLLDLKKEIDKIDGDLKTKANRLPAEYKNLTVLYEIWGHQQLLDSSFLKLNLDDFEKSLIEEHQISVYGAIVDATSTFELANKYMGINKRKLMQGGIQLACDGMPQGELITIPLSRYIGYQRNTLIIVHFKNGNPDMGRKTFQPELKGLAEKIATRITNVFVNYIDALRPDAGEDKPMIPDKEKHDYIKRIEKYRETNQLPYKAIHPNFTYLCKAQEEQDTIAIFHQLVGTGILKGLYFFSCEYNEKYDGVFEYNYDNESYLYSIGNPLGVRQDMLIPSSSEPKIMEFKFDFNSLLTEMTKDKKFFEHIHLVVCWRATGEYKENLILKSLLLENEGNIRTIYGSTHLGYLPGKYSSHKFEVIILEELLNFLVSPERELANQLIKYSHQ